MERLYRVRTPEMVEFSFPVAGLASRFLAWLVDAFCVLGIGAGVMVLLAIAGLFLAILSPNLGMLTIAAAFIAFFLVSWGYFVFWEGTWDGRTPGKRLLGLRTISDTGVRMTVAQAAIRNLFRFLDALPGVTYLIGAASHAFSE